MTVETMTFEEMLPLAVLAGTLVLTAAFMLLNITQRHFRALTLDRELARVDLQLTQAAADRDVAEKRRDEFYENEFLPLRGQYYAGVRDNAFLRRYDAAQERLYELDRALDMAQGTCDLASADLWRVRMRALAT